MTKRLRKYPPTPRKVKLYGISACEIRWSSSLIQPLCALEGQLATADTALPKTCWPVGLQKALFRWAASNDLDDLARVRIEPGSPKFTEALGYIGASKMNVMLVRRDPEYLEVLLLLHFREHGFSLSDAIALSAPHVGQGGLRTGPVFSTPHKNGVFFEFERAEEIECRIHDVEQALASLSATCPTLAAALLSARLLHIHPFYDGNGRLARAIFSSALAYYLQLRSPCLGLGYFYDPKPRNLLRIDVVSPG